MKHPTQQLACSSDLLTITAVTLSGSAPLTVDRPSIVINLSDTPLAIAEDGSTFGRLQSRLVQQVRVHGEGAIALILQTATDDFVHMSDELSDHIRATWSYDNPLAVDAHLAQQAVHVSNTLKSRKDTVNGYHIFLCHQLAGTKGRIHRIHELYEQHTQIIGSGVMQKYKEESFDTVFETAHMMPGYTHYPFYDSNKQYPWHTFVADTESVWLALVRYD
jgi:hypothetical protein